MSEYMEPEKDQDNKNKEVTVDIKAKKI